MGTINIFFFFSWDGVLNIKWLLVFEYHDLGGNHLKKGHWSDCADIRSYEFETWLAESHQRGGHEDTDGLKKGVAESTHTAG